jgi:DNA-directed RNA polymerase subunit RPC12/RpoP
MNEVKHDGKVICSKCGKTLEENSEKDVLVLTCLDCWKRFFGELGKENKPIDFNEK